MNFDVWLYGNKVALLEDDGTGALRLVYRDTPQGGPARRTVSLSLPGPSHASAQGAMRWVRAILPEDDARSQVAAHFRLDADDVPGLLAVVGRDMIGAARVVPEGEAPEHPEQGYTPANDGDVADKIARLPKNPLGVDRQRGHRMSLTGAQDKIVLHHDDGWAFPVNGAASTVIVKPEPEQYPGLVDVEFGLLRLAAAAGIAAASASRHRFDGRPALAVRRFDRETSGDAVVRIHAEEALTALGLPHTAKYQQAPTNHHLRTQPTLRKLAQLLQEHGGVPQVVRLLEHTVFHLATGDADAHIRNHTVLLAADGTVELSPMYDTVCTLAYPDVSRDLSLRIGDAHDVGEVTGPDLLAEVTSWGLPEALAVRRVTNVLSSISTATGHVALPEPVKDVVNEHIAKLAV